jgi:hypothetical protein
VQPVWTLEAADRRQFQEKAVEGLVKCVCCVSPKQAKAIEGDVMSKYVRDEEYDEPDVSASERMMPEGWYIAAALVYGVVLVMSFAFGYVCGAVS